MVNITEMESPEEYPENIWGAMLEHQASLHDKYQHVEAKSGLGYGLIRNPEFNIDDRYWQYYIKECMWRVTEELAEASEADHHGNVEHYQEEMIDALHFLLELLHICGYTPHNNWGEWTNRYVDERRKPYCVIYYLGLAANCLKNKPWKQDFRETDQAKFYQNLEMALPALRMCLRDLSDEQIYDLYFRKNQVNQFRIRSNY